MLQQFGQITQELLRRGGGFVSDLIFWQRRHVVLISMSWCEIAVAIADFGLRITTVPLKVYDFDVKHIDLELYNHS